MPSENTILNLFRRPFSFFNNSTSHYRLRTRRQKAARFCLPKPHHGRTQPARRTGILLRIRQLRPIGTGMQLDQYVDRETGLHYNFFRYYEPDAGGLIRIRLGWMVEITYTYLLSIARYGSMHWDFPKLHGGKVALILGLIVQMLQIFAKLWQIQILRIQYQML